MSWLGQWLGRWLGGWLGGLSGETSNASAVAAVYYLLANNIGLTSVVAESSIMAGVIPLETPLPAIGIQEISVTDRWTVKMDENRTFAHARIQVTAVAKTYPQQVQLIKLISLALHDTRGTINGIDVDSITADSIGPDFYNGEGTMYMQSRDFFVKFRRV